MQDFVETLIGDISLVDECAMKRNTKDTEQVIEMVRPMIPEFESRLKELEAAEPTDANKKLMQLLRRIVATFPVLQNLKAMEIPVKKQILELGEVARKHDSYIKTVKKNASNSANINLSAQSDTEDSPDLDELGFLAEVASSLGKIAQCSDHTMTQQVLNEQCGEMNGMFTFENKPSENATGEDSKKDAVLKNVEQTDEFALAVPIDEQSLSGCVMNIVGESKTTTTGINLDAKTQVAKVTFNLKKATDTQESYSENASHTTGMNEVPRQQLMITKKALGNTKDTPASSVCDGFSPNKTPEISPYFEKSISQSRTEGIKNAAHVELEMGNVVSNTNGLNAAINEAQAPVDESLSLPHNTGDSITDRQATPQICTKYCWILLGKCCWKTLAGFCLLAMVVIVLVIWMLELIGCQRSISFCTQWNENDSLRLMIENQQSLIVDLNWIWANLVLLIVFCSCIAAGIKYYVLEWLTGCNNCFYIPNLH